MDHRRHVSRAAVAAAVLLAFSLLGSGGTAQAQAQRLGAPRAAAAAQVPHTGTQHPASDLPALGKVDPAVASDGTTSLVVWSDYLTGSVPQIRAARRNASGTVLSEIVLSPSPGAQTSPSVAYNGTNFFVVWEEDGDLFGTRVTSAGVVLDGYGIPVAISRADALSAPTVASDGTDFLVGWIGRQDTGDSVFAKRVTGAGAPLDGAGFEVGSAGLYGGLTGGGPAAAYNGSSYLIVWTSDSCPFCGSLLGARVTTGGSVLNPGGFAISLDSSNQYFNEFAPSVSATGTQFVVAWTAERCTPPDDCSIKFDSDVLAGRVSASGTVLGATNIAVAVDDGYAGQATVASTATISLVAWSDARSGARDVYAARVSTAGALVDSSAIRVSTNAAPDNNATAATFGAGFAIGWRTGVDIVGASVDAAGTVGQAASVVSAGHAPVQSAPSVAWDGTEVVTVWRESRPGMPDTIRLGRSFPDGNPNDGEGTIIASGFDLGDPVISEGAQQQLVVWHQDGKIYGTRVESGHAIDQNPIVVSPSQAQFTFPQSPSVAWNGLAYLVTWADDDSGSLGIFGARVDASGAVLDPTGITIASAPGDQDFPAVASNGADFLVVWHDARSGSGYDIYGSRVSGAGAVANPAGLAISAAPGDQQYPDAAWNGSNYVVVWQDARSASSLDIYGARVSAGGAVADGSGIMISNAANDQSRPSVSPFGSDTLVVWEDRRAGSGVDLYGSRLSAAGVVGDSQGLVVTNAATDEVDPDTTDVSNGRVAVGYQWVGVGAPYRSDRVFLRVTSPK